MDSLAPDSSDNNEVKQMMENADYYIINSQEKFVQAVRS